MTAKMRFKFSVDFVMSVLFLLALGYPFTGKLPHEWLGTALFVVFTLHNVLNAGWYAALWKGKYTPFRWVLTTVNLLLLAAMIGLCVTGIFLSRDVFSFLHLGGSWTARRLHPVFAYWGFLLSAVHLGLNGGVFKPLLQRAQHRFPRWALGTAAGLLAAYGLFAVFYWKVPTQLGLAFTHMPRGRSFISFLSAHLAILFLAAGVTYWLVSKASSNKKISGGNPHA